ncbi:FtsX-like permease family protein [Symmachiella macrocystis]|uniref:FtsX-like permease family protein n=1 Tax=Symmachiella macrocystis TaxID=2527985 RepID=A0A5C6B100_9PLAN|nr:ABC transporter permease [Symmachiella macrocystis]TWU05251.1 FtsX-like permease family protein [Symmachiella macrocystis]
MVFFRPLPWEYGIRNLLRRPLRTALTLVALTIVTLLVMVVLGFVRGLDRSLMTGGQPQTVIVFSLGMGENLEYSSVPMRTADLLAASIPGIRERYGKKASSPELYLGTKVNRTPVAPPEMGLVRGVTSAALLVHENVEITQGNWPRVNEILVGRMAATKLGLTAAEIQPGRTLIFEGREWTISGTFAAAGATYESEVWCRLGDLQQAMKRQDLSLVALNLGPGGTFQEVDLFCKERLDLELQAIRQTDYFASLQKDYRPVRLLSWLVVALVSSAGVFIGLNTMYGAVIGRIPELATLQTIGFSRRAAILSIMQEGTILAMTAALLASVVAYGLIHKAAVRFTMGAFELQIDTTTLLIGYGIALFLGIVGSLPPAIRIFRLSVVDGLRAI